MTELLLTLWMAGTLWAALALLFAHATANEITQKTGGMASNKTLRDWFAGQALVGLLSHEWRLEDSRSEAARIAYEFADQMVWHSLR